LSRNILLATPVFASASHTSSVFWSRLSCCRTISCGPRALSPFSALGVFLALVVTSGVALGAFAVLLVASLVLYFLLSEVLGLDIELRPAPF